MRPVPTVPRPVIVKTSSIGIRNGLSTARSGVGMYTSTASIRAKIGSASGSPRLPLDWSALSAEPRMTGQSSPGNSYELEQLADFQLDEFEQLVVVDHVGLVEEHDDVRHADLASSSRMCSRVCGIGPSVADTTRIAPSICAAPVIMFLM